jgi:hypothetical protein
MNRTHRSTHVRVSNQPENSNFDAGTALENLRAEMIEIEALARAAEAASDALRCPSLADDGSPAPGIRPDPVADHQDVAAGERVAPVRQCTGRRALLADGGTAQGGTSLAVASVVSTIAARSERQRS